jgi:hypothetical protein
MGTFKNNVRQRLKRIIKCAVIAEIHAPNQNVIFVRPNKRIQCEPLIPHRLRLTLGAPCNVLLPKFERFEFTVFCLRDFHFQFPLLFSFLLKGYPKGKVDSCPQEALYASN